MKLTTERERENDCLKDLGVDNDEVNSVEALNDCFDIKKL
jgi:hypothetical protein